MPPVLLIDEVDRADDEFEAFLLEILSEFAITVPELGTIQADRPPIAILTSNRTREVHDALKRRCLYFYIDHPSLETGGRNSAPQGARRGRESWLVRWRPTVQRLQRAWISTSHPA